MSDKQKVTTGYQWKWRDDELSLPEFYKLPQQEKNEYILLIQGLDPEHRSSMDEILFNRFGRTKGGPTKFLEL
jgi:hypothetical protein